jgi:hypothetical protein
MTNEPDDAPDAPDAIVGDVLKVLDIAIVEWLPDSSCIPLAKAPRWFTGYAAWSSLPFLEHFVTEARRYLHDHFDEAFASAPFTATGHKGELLLRARALKISQRLVLVIERLEGDVDLRPLLREARQQALEHETAADQARAIHAPLAAVAAAMAQLQQAPAIPEPLLDSLTRALADLQAAAQALPPPRRRR